MERSGDEEKCLPSTQISPRQQSGAGVKISEKNDQLSMSYTTRLCLLNTSEHKESSTIEHVLTPNLNSQKNELDRSSTTISNTECQNSSDDYRHPDFEVQLDLNDPENPKSWPLWYRSIIVACVSLGSFSVVFHSTTYMRNMPGMLQEFKLRDSPLLTLGVTTYLSGIATGSLILAPLSEMYGRRPVYSVSMFIFVILVLPCALAKSLPTIIVGRYFSAFAGSVMVSNAAGSISDNFSGKYRPLALSLWSLAPLNGPAIGFLTAGFVSEKLGWRWNNWIVMTVSGIAWAFLSSIKETYHPALVRKKVLRLKKETKDNRWWSPYDHELNLFHKLRDNISRPFILTYTEPILWFWNIYIALIYGTFYLSLVSFPIVFGQIRGWSQGITGLAFSGVAVGTLLAIACEPLLRYIVDQHKKDPETGRIKPESSVIAVCLASILSPVAQLCFAWTSTPITIHWILPVLSGIPLGAGYFFVMVYGVNYITESYGIYAASALAGNVVSRNIVGGIMPLVGSILYRKIGPRWTGTVLGALLMALIPIPFTFYFYGHKIRAKSLMLKKMRLLSQLEEKSAGVMDSSRNKGNRILIA
ncbi:Citrinin biosynthesis cluster MFS transporter mrr1 [Golovinomyces cichoracearum]|uniref:Citrinin biosynthesis cluster MFS transporter mrr1 n=1 Tax=Golovinomyces cichoracearum TaxID=62708 RepID=A0A420IMA8_9PEZI|nr:Citrinin biosynthesis cluster MFS transporter mrr1 [Golovinomyces cichoracearum]